MTALPTRPLWAGRTAAILGIVLLALNLRTAVGVLSPILSAVSADVPLSSIGVGLLGMLPPLAFAASGFVAPAVGRRIGLELTTVLACAAMVVGPLLRATALSYPMLVLGSVVVLAGMGFANILLPPIVKIYFPDRVGLITGTYVTLMSISASVPPLIAAPLADSVGWRATVGVWALLAAAALVPWVMVLLQHRRGAGAQSTGGQQASATGDEPPGHSRLGPIHRSTVARALALAFAVTALNVYALFAWLPEIVMDTAGATAAEAGALVALFGIVGLPLGLLAPVVAARVRNIGWVFGLAVACYLVGYVGLLALPGVATWLWVLLTGTGPLVFPLCLVLINLRTRSREGSIALSGFVQGIGYALGALGPLLIAVLHDLTHGWTVPLLVLLALSLLTAISAVALARPRMVEDELALRRPGPPDERGRPHR